MHNQPPNDDSGEGDEVLIELFREQLNGECSNEKFIDELKKHLDPDGKKEIDKNADIRKLLHNDKVDEIITENLALARECCTVTQQYTYCLSRSHFLTNKQIARIQKINERSVRSCIEITQEKIDRRKARLAVIKEEERVKMKKKQIGEKIRSLCQKTMRTTIYIKYKHLYVRAMKKLKSKPAKYKIMLETI